MQFGKPDRQIRVMHNVEGAANALNEKALTPTLYGKFWAAKADVRDSERIRSQEVGALVTTRFRVRWSEKTRAILPMFWIELGGRIYSITGVKEADEGNTRRAWVEITAAARAETVLP